MIEKGDKVHNNIVKAAQGTYFTKPTQLAQLIATISQNRIASQLNANGDFSNNFIINPNAFKKGGLINKKETKMKPKERIKVGQKGLKTAQTDSITAYNRINSSESESGKGPQSSKQVLATIRKGNFGPGNTKKDYDKSLKDTKAINKKEIGGKMQSATKALPLTKKSVKKDEKKNDDLSKPNRIGFAKCGKKIKPKK
jgi:hypothetical protein